MKENEFLEIIKQTLPSSARYIGDDTAYIEDKGLILTQDTLIEDVHFRRSTISAFDLGIKSVAVNLSDIAASGGIAKYILISLSLPSSIDGEFVREFYEGINKICLKYGVLVVGGDITGSEKICITITAIGESQGLMPAKRNCAKPDYIIIVTDNHGSSRAGLWLLEENNTNIPENIRDKFIKTHINPVPRLETGRKILELSKTQPAMMDTSDGLADALWKISSMSNVSMEMDFSNIPFDKNLEAITALAKTNPIEWVLYGGEDYELVACVSEECFQKLINEQIPVKRIGNIVPVDNQPEIRIKYNDEFIIINQNSIDNKGFDHFKKKVQE